jgi:Enoyl-CoA hydratase/isomerase
MLSLFSPAGGCLLAMSCDYRVMVRKNFNIGLNETQLGIVAPFWFRVKFIVLEKYESGPILKCRLFLWCSRRKKLNDTRNAEFASNKVNLVNNKADFELNVSHSVYVDAVPAPAR